MLGSLKKHWANKFPALYLWGIVALACFTFPGALYAAQVSISARVPEIATSTIFNYASSTTHTFTNASGTTVVFDFSANTFTENFKLQINSYLSQDFAGFKPPVSGKSFVGKTYDFDFYNISGTAAFATTSATVSISMYYADADVAGLDESTLRPYRWGSGDSSWQLISGFILDTANNKVTFSTDHFSSFSLLGDPAQQQQQQQQQQQSSSVGGGSIAVYTQSLSDEKEKEKKKKEIIQEKILKLTDLNNDKKVNLVDLSILLYHFNKPVSAAALSYDLNNDGAINLIDVSILLYYWSA